MDAKLKTPGRMMRDYLTYEERERERLKAEIKSLTADYKTANQGLLAAIRDVQRLAAERDRLLWLLDNNLNASASEIRAAYDKSKSD